MLLLAITFSLVSISCTSNGDLLENVPNEDDDEDRVTNVLDKCKDTPEGKTVNTNGCAASQLDDDNDGVANNLDNCPNTPSCSSVDMNGCLIASSVQQRLDTGETPLQIINTGIATSELIGKSYGGSLIFHMRPDGTGLISNLRMPDFADRDGYNTRG